MNINKIIKNRRTELGLTLKDVANALGIAESTVSRYESSDIQNMGIDKIESLAKILKCSPAYLMGWSDSINGNGEHDVYMNIQASSKNEAIHIAVKNMLKGNGYEERAKVITEDEAVKLYALAGFDAVEKAFDTPQTISAHFSGEDYTEDELEEIKQFAAFVKSRKK